MSGDNDTRIRTTAPNPTPHAVACFLFINYRGKAQGINAEGLALALKITVRSLRHFISNARKEGHPICSTPETGYFLPETSEEFEQTIAFLESRAMHSLATISTMRKGFNQYSQYGQTTFLTNPNQGV